ncbi:hypothetical protein BRC81_11725 [Halobacteriales archaeon QS_1_68_20]|nr:MAG: hypothetical protein BRC81_11725 [Halobacteriales archaeon QS_1_68_20]
MSSLSDSFGALARSAAIVFVGTVLGRILSLLGEVVIIRSLAPEAFGTVALAYTVVLTVTRIGILGVPDGVSRMLSDETIGSRERHFLTGGYVIVLGSGAVIATLLYLFGDALGTLMNEPQLSDLVVLFVPFVFLFPLAMVSIAVLRARKRPLGATLSQHVGARIGAIGVFVAFAYFGRPFVGAVAYWIVTPAFAALLALSLVSREYSIRSITTTLPSGDSIRDLWSFSWPLAIRTSLVTLMTNLDVLMIGFFLESTMVGFYRSVQPLRQVTLFVLQSFVFLFLPLATEYYTRTELDELRELYRVSSKWIALLTLPPVLVFSLFAPDVVRTILHPEYLPGAAALSVLTAGLFFNALVGPNGAMLKAVDRPRIEMFAAILGVVTNLALNVALIPVLGIVGAAVATVVGYFVFNVAEVVAIYRIVGTHPFSRNSLEPIVVTTLAGLAIALVTGGTRFSLPELIGIGMLLVAVQAVAVVLTRSFDEADQVLIEQAKRRIGLD